jgi:hypothetical protein
MRRNEWEDHRKGIIRDIVYRGTPIRQVAQKFNVSISSVTRHLKAWGVSLPLHLCGFPRQCNWYMYKKHACKKLPSALRNCNRSTMVSLYAVHTQYEIAKIFNVSSYYITMALDYHCIGKRSREEAYRAFAAINTGVIPPASRRYSPARSSSQGSVYHS